MELAYAGEGIGLGYTVGGKSPPYGPLPDPVLPRVDDIAGAQHTPTPTQAY